MDALVKKELKKNVNMISQTLNFVTDENLPTNEIIKEEFNSIRILVDYCEKLALEGSNAIETV